MEENFRKCMMPAWDKFIKVLSASFAENSTQGCNLWRLEMMLLQAVTAMAVAALRILIELAHGWGYEGARRECPGCDGKMKFEGYRSRQLLSNYGPLVYQRAYYHCRSCHQGYTPLDERLEVGHRAVTPRLWRLIAFLGAHLSFGVVEQALEESQGQPVNREVVRLLAEESGRQARRWECAEEARWRQEPHQLTAGRPPKTWIIECDGKQVGYQDGSWHEVKVGVIYELGDRVESRPGRAELLKREIVARRAHWEEFAGLFWSAMQRAGVAEGDRVVAVADGAEAMEQIFAFVAPGATRVRDFYHVSEKLHAVGEVRFGTGTPECQQWTSAQLHKLKHSELKSVLRSIAHLKLSTAEAAETRRQVVQYLEKNRYAMDYARYEKAGWPLGSGAVEGGCRLIGARTNGLGRRWSESGCDDIVALRVAVLNDRLELLLPKPRSSIRAAA
jgi:hypothetical protein